MIRYRGSAPSGSAAKSYKGRPYADAKAHSSKHHRSEHGGPISSSLLHCSILLERHPRSALPLYDEPPNPSLRFRREFNLNMVLVRWMAVLPQRRALTPTIPGQSMAKRTRRRWGIDRWSMRGCHQESWKNIGGVMNSRLRAASVPSLMMSLTPNPELGWWPLPRQEINRSLVFTWQSVLGSDAAIRVSRYRSECHIARAHQRVIDKFVWKTFTPFSACASRSFHSEVRLMTVPFC
jgi:hypothetical protein